MATLNPNQKIHDVLGEIKRGTYRIPNIQRGYEWDKPRIAKLLDSIMNGYPIGAIMVWKPTPDIQKDISDRNFIADFCSDEAYIADDPHPSDKEAYLVLDGQQRLQSLYLSFFGSYDGERVYMAVDHMPSKDADDDDYDFSFLPPQEAKTQPQMVSLIDIVNMDSDAKFEFADRLARTLSEPTTDPEERQRVESDKRSKIFKNIDRFIERFNVHPVLLIQEVSSKLTYDHVLEIFERVNSGGMVLSKSDLLFSTLKLRLKEKEADFRKTLDAINHGRRYAFDTDFIIKTSLVVFGKGAKYDVKKLRDSKYIEDLRNKYAVLDKCLRQMVAWLDETALIKCDRFLPSRSALIPLIDYMMLSERHEKPDGKNSHAMKQYLHMSFFTRLFGRAGDAVLDKIHKQMDLSVKAGDASGAHDFPLELIKSVIAERTHAQYGLSEHHFEDDAALMLNIAEGGRIQIDPEDPTRDPKDLKLEVDHIFPRSKLWDLKLGDIADRLGNFRLVVLPVNRRKLASWPDAKTDFCGANDKFVSDAYQKAVLHFDRETYSAFESERAAFIRRKVEEFLDLKTGVLETVLPVSTEVSSTEPSAETVISDVSLDLLYKQADESGIGADFRRLCEAGQKMKLYPRLWKTSVMFAPPASRIHMIFTVWTWPKRDKVQVCVSAEAIAKYFPISESEAASIIGEESPRYLDSDGVTKFIRDMEEVFSRIGQKTNGVQQ